MSGLREEIQQARLCMLTRIWPTRRPKDLVVVAFLVGHVFEAAKGVLIPTSCAYSVAMAFVMFAQVWISYVQRVGTV
jgi:hypothetical protein